MATINIANLTFTHKGDYDGSTAYVKNDVVYYSTNGNAYIAKQNTTGNVPTNATYWSQFAQGSGGIWNAGLSLGSAGQQLRVNSGGNALEFATIESGTTAKIAEWTHSSDVATVQINNIGLNDSLYSYYRWVWCSRMANNNTSISARWVDSGGSPVSSASYRLRGYDFYKYGNGSSGTGGVWNSNDGSNNTNMKVRSWNQDGDSNALQFAHGYIYRLTGKYTMWENISAGTDDSGNGGWNFSYYANSEYESTTAPTGIQFYNGQGYNFTEGFFRLYGIKK